LFISLLRNSRSFSCYLALIVRLFFYLRTPGGSLEFGRQIRVDSMEASMDQARRQRIRDDLSRRLKRACAHLADDQFRELVETMTDRQINGERRIIRDLLPE
jgi:hypothetical protein